MPTWIQSIIGISRMKIEEVTEVETGMDIEEVTVRVTEGKVKEDQRGLRPKRADQGPDHYLFRREGRTVLEVLIKGNLFLSGIYLSVSQKLS